MPLRFGPNIHEERTTMTGKEILDTYNLDTEESFEGLEGERFTLSYEDGVKMLDTLQRPAKPSPKLVEALRKI